MGSPKVSKPIGEAGVRIDVNQCMANLEKVGKKCLKVYGYSGGSENVARPADCYQLAIEYPSGMVENFRKLFPFIETPNYLLVQITKKKKCENRKCLPHLESFVYKIILGEKPVPYGYISHETSGELVDLVSGSRLIENTLVLNPTNPRDEQLLKSVLKYIGNICPQIVDWPVKSNYTPRSEAFERPNEIRPNYME